MSFVRNLLVRLIGANENEIVRDKWLAKTLHSLHSGLRILDAGAGELRNKPLCSHLIYVSQDVCRYEGKGDSQGLQMGTWDTSKIDLICDIVDIPEPDGSFDVVLCSEVFEHLPDALLALNEFSRLLKPGGVLILTAPFASLVHFAPYHFVSGFSRYWYESHLPARNFQIRELTPNGDWFTYLKQELFRLPAMARRCGDWCWFLSYFVTIPAVIYFLLRGQAKKASDVACFGWHCIAVKRC